MSQLNTLKFPFRRYPLKSAYFGLKPQPPNIILKNSVVRTHVRIPRSWVLSSCSEELQLTHVQMYHSGLKTAVRLFFFLRFYLFIHERHKERQRHRQREKQDPCREPTVGLDPRTLRSRPELKAEAQPMNHPGAPAVRLNWFSFSFWV